MNKIFFALLATILLTTGCQKYRLKQDDKTIQDYLSQKGITNAVKTSSGLYYVVDAPGGTEKPLYTSLITLHYEGRLTSDSIFDSSYRRGFTSSFSPSQVVTGFGEGIRLFGRGGKGTLFIPSGLAYGNQAKPAAGKNLAKIPKNSVLIFKVDIIDF